jgi:hypothetical protein
MPLSPNRSVVTPPAFCADPVPFVGELLALVFTTATVVIIARIVIGARAIVKGQQRCQQGN